MKLKQTQIAVLGVLVKNKDKWLGLEDIKKQCSVNRQHINLAIKFFIENDYVYNPNLDGKVQVSTDGISLYNEYI